MKADVSSHCRSSLIGASEKAVTYFLIYPEESNDRCILHKEQCSVTSKAISGTDAAKVGNPYGICVAPGTGDIYIADADYTGPGKVWCFTKDLKEKWSAVAGMLPAHMVLY